MPWRGHHLATAQELVVPGSPWRVMVGIVPKVSTLGLGRRDSEMKFERQDHEARSEERKTTQEY